MARMKEPEIPVGEQGEILPDEPTGEEEAKARKQPEDRLVSWVMERVNRWKTHRNANYEEVWNRYEQIWRGIYVDNDKNKKSERSRIVSPATAEAVESAASEIEEAVFGRGDFFDMWPEASDKGPDREALSKNEITFREDLASMGFTNNCSEVILLGAVYGTGIIETVMTTEVRHDITSEQVPILDDDGTPMQGENGQPAVKIEPRVSETTLERPVARSVSPRNFIIDPSARGIDDALGVAIEEDVGSHIVNEGIREGTYRKIEIGTGSEELRTKPDPQMENPWIEDVVPIIRYYGKVPKYLLDTLMNSDSEESDEDFVELYPSEEKEPSSDPKDAELVEAWVVIANNEKLLMAKPSPDMMKDRPVVAWQWDVVPNRFWGRGICEKGNTSQKLLDAELRARIDALAYVSAPMMAMDASRLPRGFKLEVYPGKNVLLAGDPSEILKPFKFGELDANSVQQVELLDRMHQRATGAIDAAAMAQAGASGQARSGAVSMAMAGIVKRNKRTLTRYINSFLGPVLYKLMWRFIQYNPERYIPLNPTFNIASTMGIMQREYETQNLAQLLNTMQAGTSEHIMILMGIVANSGIHARDQIMQLLNQRLQKIMAAESAPPADQQQQQPPMDPVMIEMQRADAQIELALKMAKLRKIEAETGLIQAETQSEMVEPQLHAQEIALRGIYKTSQDRINEEFDRRMELARISLERDKVASDERIADKQIVAARVANEKEPVPVRVPVPVPVRQRVPVPVPVFPVR